MRFTPKNNVHLSGVRAQAAVVNLDDPGADLVRAAASAVPVVTYGIDNMDADVVAETAKIDIWESEVCMRV